MVKNQVIYQLALRTYTEEGTLNAAKEHLGELKQLGIDIIYLTACFKTDVDSDKATWSPRQIASECNNPSNPYKMADYFTVDPEYGTNEDLKDFIDCAHGLNMKVLLDLVYLHCGRNAVFLKDNPDFVLQNEDGTPLVGKDWPFARLNYKNKALREYLFENGEFFVKSFKADGFRCDVGSEIPLDFWQEFVKRVKALNPQIIMFNEGVNPDYLGVFDCDYNGIGRLFDLTPPLELLFSGKWEEFLEFINAEDKRNVNFIENHDMATDFKRYELRHTNGQTELSLFLMYVLKGIPFIWNGNEYADESENCMFSNRFFGNRSTFDRSKINSEKAKERFDFVKKLNGIYHEHPVLADGSLEIAEKESIIKIIRENNDEKLTVVFNPSDKTVKAENISGKILISKNAELSKTNITLKKFGFALLSEN